MRDPQVYQEYSSFLKEYEDLGHMTEISNHNAVEVGYFIPHHPIFKRDSHTTKIRIVFDASSKTITGISLNNVLLDVDQRFKRIYFQ